MHPDTIKDPDSPLIGVNPAVTNVSCESAFRDLKYDLCFSAVLLLIILILTFSNDIL